MKLYLSYSLTPISQLISVKNIPLLLTVAIIKFIPRRFLLIYQPSETMATMINCSYSNKTFPQDVCLEGYLVCMRRIIRLSSMLDFFTCFSMEDQKALLLTNTDMIVNIRTARFFQRGVHLKKHILFVNNTDDDPKYGRMDTFQIFQSPWACSEKDEKKYNDLMKKIFDLQLDEISTVLISMMSLFSSTNAKIHDELRANKTQEFFTNLMKKYIIHHVGKDAACQLLPKYIFMIAHLEEMAQIMVSKRLNI
ncbi:uncharacterized protein [Lepeophtheirus salmonis]|uniref:uncharacterized protein n=1 Tax=Lepeophtheirus salmonis TaxID=72036 RepID=UPI003AF3379E